MYGKAQRSLRLPKNVDENKMSAKYDSGVLHIVIPKVPEPQKQEKVCNVDQYKFNCLTVTATTILTFSSCNMYTCT